MVNLNISTQIITVLSPGRHHHHRRRRPKTINTEHCNNAICSDYKWWPTPLFHCNGRGLRGLTWVKSRYRRAAIDCHQFFVGLGRILIVLHGSTTAIHLCWQLIVPIMSYRPAANHPVAPAGWNLVIKPIFTFHCLSHSNKSQVAFTKYSSVCVCM